MRAEGPASGLPTVKEEDDEADGVETPSECARPRAGRRVRALARPSVDSTASEIRCEALVVLRKHKVVVLWTPSSHGRRHAESGLFFTYRCPNTSNTAARSACRRCTVSQNTSSGGAWGRGAMRQNVCGGANLAPDMRVR